MNGKWKRLLVTSASCMLLNSLRWHHRCRAIAADYPSRPLHLVVPFPPGGAADILARGMVSTFSERLRQQIVVDNRPGANGVIGFEVVARSPADGYTLLLGFTTGVAINPFLTEGFLRPRTGLCSRQHAFADANDADRQPIPAGKVRAGADCNVEGCARQVELCVTRNRQPESYCRELFKMAAGVNLVHVPYKGAGPAMVDVMAGHVPIAFVTLAAALPQVREGKLKSLAITSNARWPTLPAVPTMAEAGLSGVESSSGSAFLPGAYRKSGDLPVE